MTPPPLLPPLAALEHAAVGAPVTRAGVSLFPVYLFQPLPTGVVSGRPGTVEIAEAEEASVPTLVATSLADEPVLLAEGETVAGGRQQRTLNVSVLLPPRARVEIPVSCVEAGRWGGGQQFTGTSGHTSRRVRRAKSATVARNLRRTGHKASDQGLVWRSVDFELDRLGVQSDSRNYADAEAVYDRHAGLAEALDDLVAMGPLPHQRGIVVAHGSRVVAGEVFATPELLADRWQFLARAALLDQPHELRGRPSASRALRFLRRLASGRGVEAPGVGLGVERHVETSRLVGQVLTLDDAVVHASAFALAA